jgi:hypothetical protein
MAGKTYTMIGGEEGGKSSRGLLGRSVDYIFEALKARQDTHDFKVIEWFCKICFWLLRQNLYGYMMCVTSALSVLGAPLLLMSFSLCCASLMLT